MKNSFDIDDLLKWPLGLISGWPDMSVISAENLRNI